MLWVKAFHIFFFVSEIFVCVAIPLDIGLLFKQAQCLFNILEQFGYVLVKGFLQ